MHSVKSAKDWYMDRRTWKKEDGEEHSDNSFQKIGQNTKKSPGDLGRLVVAQTPVRDHQLTLV